MIACGRADIFYEVGNLKPWDMAGGEIIIYEAGGVVLLPEGKPFDCTKGKVLCCNHAETAKLILKLGILS